MQGLPQLCSAGADAKDKYRTCLPSVGLSFSTAASVNRIAGINATPI
jgi:hypothetical protein